MNIFITEFDETLVSWGDRQGWQIVFRSGITSGTALLADDGCGSPAARERNISVELDQREVVNARFVGDGEPMEARLTALPEEGNYEAVGKVLEVSDSETEGFSVIEADVNGAGWFCWLVPDADRDLFAAGDWICFTLVGLMFWDRQY